MTVKPQISKADIVDALLRSGYLMEYRVEQVLRSRGYAVQSNLAYPDAFTGKPRELDMRSLAARSIDADERHWIFPLCLFECVNNPYPMAFLTKESQSTCVDAFHITVSGLPATIRRDYKRKERWIGLPEYLNMEKYHHHCSGRVATQFCSFTPKKNKEPSEWMASHEDSHFNSFSKLCAAVDHEVEDHFNQTHPVQGDRINLQIYYPILVVGGVLIDVRPGSTGELEIGEVDHIIYEQTIILKTEERHYNIDVVAERSLPALLEKIEKETEETARLLARRLPKLQATIGEMAKRASAEPDTVQNIIRPKRY
jgi:hypothetical protein